MRESLLAYIVCPEDHGALTLEALATRGDRIESGTLTCGICGRTYPVRNFVPRFVVDDGYVESFSHEWTTFSRTQLDSVNGTTMSREYFARSTGRQPEDLHGVVLDVGCGTGRMLDLFRGGDATAIGIDLSFAVDVAVRVLDQRTIGGRNVDFLFPLFAYRHITRRMDPARLLRALRWYVPTACRLRRLPVLGSLFRFMMPVADYKGVLPLDDAQLREWNLLDTFDRFSPRYYYRYSWNELRRWFLHEDLEDVALGSFPVSAHGTRKGAAAVGPAPNP